MYETKIDIFNKLKDEKRVKDICKILNQYFVSILEVDSKFTYLGSKGDGYFTIYNENKYSKNRSIDLSFRLYYPQKKAFYYDKELNEYVESRYNKSKLFYVEILWFSVKPTGKGIGSNIVKELIEALKSIENIEFILLHPKDNNAKSFWMRNSFIEDDLRVTFDRRIKLYINNKLIYKY